MYAIILHIQHRRLSLVFTYVFLRVIILEIQMKLSELLKLLKNMGCYIIRHGKKHDIWISPLTGRRFTVPRHSGKEIPAGTADSILEAAGKEKDGQNNG
jgi:predicted RNA binding protein YcfA (HicA-like mRNA interferase family)